MNHSNYSLDDLGSPAGFDYVQHFLENVSSHSFHFNSGDNLNEENYTADIVERKEDVERHESYLILHRSSPFQSRYQRAKFVDIIEYGNGEFSLAGDDPYFKYAEKILSSENPSRTTEIKHAEASLIDGINRFFSRLV